jgi:hypothetical protein
MLGLRRYNRGPFFLGGAIQEMNRSFFRFLTAGCITVSLFIISACGEEHKKLGESGSGKWSHNEGRDCTGCHETRYAGTVYKSASGGVAPNAVITIIENGGAVVEVTADNGGNFYTSRGNPSGGYTATVKGNTLAMVSKPTSGACSSSGCHDGALTPRVFMN